jgi:ribose transport system substrate-binding protein
VALLTIGGMTSHYSRRSFLRWFHPGLLLCGLWIASPWPEVNAAEKKPKAVIGVSLLTMANPFFRDLGEAMKQEAAKHGMEVILTAGEFDAAKQRNQVADFIVRRVDAIVLSPCDSKAVGTAVAEANKAGIPVFTADIACLAAGVKIVSHVATDNLGGGRLAAQALVEAVGGRGKVAILDHPEVESAILRTKGFNEELARLRKEKGVTVELVATLPGGAAKDRSMKAMEDLAQAHPDLAGVFAINDPSALGAVAALEKAGKLGQIKIVGFDGMPEGLQAIRDGKIYADPVQFPDRIGRTAVQNVVKYLAGDEVKAEMLIPTALYRKADAGKELNK